MANYANMYQRLFQAQTEAIEILQDAQRDAEELYISAPDTNITVLNPVASDEGTPKPEE